VDCPVRSTNATSQVVTIPISNDGQPGESDAIIPLTLSSPGAGATLGEATTASLVIRDNNSLPPPVTADPLRIETVKIGSGKRAKSTTGLVLEFSGALNAGAAQNLAVYQLDQATHTKKGGTQYNKPVALASVSYNTSTDTVTLLAGSKLSLAQPEELRITASQLPDIYGRPLDGNDDGQPGGKFVALLTKSSVQIESIATPSTMTAKAVDALFEREELAGLRHAFRKTPDGRSPSE